MIRKFFTYLLIAAASMAVACSPIDGGTDDGGNNNNQGGGDPEKPVEVRNLYSYLLNIIEDNKEARANGDEIKKVYIVAHRANSKEGKVAGAPDNSVAAIGYAIKAGADMVELDVRTTKDGYFVMVHDETLTATTGQKKYVAELTLEEIKSYPMKTPNGKYYKDAEGNFIYTPTLQEALTACKDKIYVNLDLKAVGNERKLIKAILEVGMGNQVMLYQTGYGACRDYIEYAMAEGVDNLCVHPHISKASDASAYKQLPSAKLFQYSYDLWIGGTSISRDMHKENLLTYSNILNYDAQIYQGKYSMLDKFLESDTDFIQTDYCELVEAYLKQKGLR
ncbi:MAG: glycerophosphodiester phosphodiesterase family protein [Alistipes sp.]|nr:glycerophosphodiester phosphodiesterase family protein [Alistipes sp.]